MINFIRKKIQQRFYAGDHARMVAQGKIPDPEVSLKRLNKLGFNPETIYDVGAYQGDFAKMCLRIWPHSVVHAFEPLPEKMPVLREALRSSNVTLINRLVGDENKANVHFFADETASSLLDSYPLGLKGNLNLSMVTLDSYVEAGNPVPDLLKIDTQGYEYQIFKGFEKHLSQVQVILVELNILEIYYHVTLAQDVLHFLGQYGFVVYDVTEIHRRPLDDALINIDFILVKNDDFLRRDKRWNKK